MKLHRTVILSAAFIGILAVQASADINIGCNTTRTIGSGKVGTSCSTGSYEITAYVTPNAYCWISLYSGNALIKRVESSPGMATAPSWTWRPGGAAPHSHTGGSSLATR